MIYQDTKDYCKEEQNKSKSTIPSLLNYERLSQHPLPRDGGAVSDTNNSYGSDPINTGDAQTAQPICSDFPRSYGNAGCTAGGYYQNRSSIEHDVWSDYTAELAQKRTMEIDAELQTIIRDHFTGMLVLASKQNSVATGKGLMTYPPVLDLVRVTTVRYVCEGKELFEIRGNTHNGTDSSGIERTCIFPRSISEKDLRKRLSEAGIEMLLSTRRKPDVYDHLKVYVIKTASDMEIPSSEGFMNSGEKVILYREISYSGLIDKSLMEKRLHVIDSEKSKKSDRFNFYNNPLYIAIHAFVLFNACLRERKVYLSKVPALLISDSLYISSICSKLGLKYYIAETRTKEDELIDVLTTEYSTAVFLVIGRMITSANVKRLVEIFCNAYVYGQINGKSCKATPIIVFKDKIPRDLRDSVILLDIENAGSFETGFDAVKNNQGSIDSQVDYDMARTDPAEVLSTALRLFYRFYGLDISNDNYQTVQNILKAEIAGNQKLLQRDSVPEIFYQSLEGWLQNHRDELMNMHPDVEYDLARLEYLDNINDWGSVDFIELSLEAFSKVTERLEHMYSNKKLRKILYDSCILLDNPDMAEKGCYRTHERSDRGRKYRLRVYRIALNGEISELINKLNVVNS